MPTVKPPTDLVEALEKEVKGKGDADTLRDILDRLGQHSGVNMQERTACSPDKPGHLLEAPILSLAGMVSW